MAWALRNLLWLYLFLHGYLHFKEYLSLPALVGFWVIGWAGGELAARIGSRLSYLSSSPLPRRFSLFLPFLLGGLIPPSIYFLTRTTLLLLASLSYTLRWDSLLLSLDRHFFFLLLPTELLLVSTLCGRAWKLSADLEPALRGLLLAALFFPEGAYQARLYSHPLSLAISVSLFLFAELGYLVLTRRGAKGKIAEAGGPLNPSILSALGRWGAALSALRACARSSLPQLLRSALRGIPLVFAVLLTLFLSYERYTIASLQARGGLLKAEMFQFDFTHYLTLEPEIRQGKDLVLLYRRGEPVDRYLLKRYVLDGYSRDKGFYKDPASLYPPNPETVPGQATSYPTREVLGRKTISQEIYAISLDPQALVTLDYPVRVIPYKNWPQSSFSQVYQVEAMALSIFPLELSEVQGPGMERSTLSYYTEYGRDERIRRLAAEITQGIDTYYDKVQAICDYLKYDYFYSLKPGKAADGDQLSHFLFTSKKGYCSYFAFSMALLCRSLGIPARVVIGFFIDQETQVLGYYPVRSDMAHAWVEVYFGGYGWVDFDPTSRTLAPGEKVPPPSPFARETLTSLLKEIFSHPLEAVPPLTDSKRFTLPSPFAWISLPSFWAMGLGMSLLLGLLGGGLWRRYRYWVGSRVTRSHRKKTIYAFRALLQDLGPFGFSARTPGTVGQALEEFRLSSGQSPAAAPRQGGTTRKGWAWRPPEDFFPLLEELFFLYQKARFDVSFGGPDAERFFSLLRQSRSLLYQGLWGPQRALLILHPRTFRRPLP